MTPDRAQLVRAAAASAAAALRVQGAAGHRGWAAADVAGVVEKLERIERALPATSPSAPQSAPIPSRTTRSASTPHVAASAPAPQSAPTPPAPALQTAPIPPAPALQTAPKPPAPALQTATAPASTAPLHVPPAVAPAPAPRAGAQLAAQPWLEPSPGRAAGPASFDLGALLATGADGLGRVRAVMGDCRRCGLCERRTNLVFGVGNVSARLFFVGEGPGADEDAQGEPFVGRAGELLNRMIAAMGLRRDEVYIANVVKCRPPENREPTLAEVSQCLPFLKAQIASVSPEVVVTLGRSALQALAGRPVTMRSSRGRWLDLDGIAVMPTFHPAYILRLRDDELLQARREAWTDLQAVMARLGLRAPGRTDER